MHDKDIGRAEPSRAEPLRLLLFSDLHCDSAAAARLAGQSAEFDVLVGAGDFANLRRGLDRCLAPFAASERPLVFVAGNNETADELRSACQRLPKAHVLHGEAVTLCGQVFFGLGGAVPETPFGDWSFDLSEREASQLLAKCPEGAVLVSHSPPRGVLDVSSRGDHLGSVSVRDRALQVRARLVVCGHIHHSGGQQDWLQSVPVINAGPLGIEWTLQPHTAAQSQAGVPH